VKTRVGICACCEHPTIWAAMCVEVCDIDV